MDTKEATLEMVGGKGRSLARMANAGFEVPGGILGTALLLPGNSVSPQ